MICRPYQRSLLLTQEFKWTDMKGKAVGGDEVISLYSLPQGLSVAVYKVLPTLTRVMVHCLH